MKIIEVEAVPREGFGSRWRAHREFKPGEPQKLEVLDQEDDYINGSIGTENTYDAATTVEVDVVNHTTGRTQKAKRPHPTRIGRKAYEEIKKDPVLRIREGGDVDAKLSQEALDAARKQASELGGKLVDAQAQLAEVTAENARLKARVAELETAGKQQASELGGKPAEVTGDDSKASGGKGAKR